MRKADVKRSPNEQTVASLFLPMIVLKAYEKQVISPAGKRPTGKRCWNTAGNLPGRLLGSWPLLPSPGVEALPSHLCWHWGPPASLTQLSRKAPSLLLMWMIHFTDS